jgi:hypothetical protein
MRRFVHGDVTRNKKAAGFAAGGFSFGSSAESAAESD